MSNGSSVAVSNRQRMARLLEERMNRTYSSLSELQELEPDTSLVKTFLVEAHNGGSEDLAAAEEALESTFTAIDHPFVSDLRITPADESGLATVEVHWKNEHVAVFADFSNPRFWLLHSTSSSTSLSWLLHRLVGVDTELDSAWIPAQMLESLTELGPFRGLSLDYDRRKVPDVDFKSPDAPAEMLKMQLWGSKAGEVLRLLRQEGGFARETTLSKVKIKYWLEGDEDAFTLDDVKYNGKITARGTSFQSHITLTSRLYDRYRNAIHTLEDEYSLGWDDDEPQRYSGEAIYVNFSSPIENLGEFCGAVFGSKEPFRLWGVPREVSPDFYSVRAVDLHANTSLDFEISPEWMRVYLRKGACGNSILRLFTNLQHYYDGQVQLSNAADNAIIEF